MRTLAEIEAAVDKLPAGEQKILLQFIANRVQRSEALAGDPMITVGQNNRVEALAVLQGRLALDASKVGAWQTAVREARR